MEGKEKNVVAAKTRYCKNKKLEELSFCFTILLANDSLQQQVQACVSVYANLLEINTVQYISNICSNYQNYHISTNCQHKGEIINHGEELQTNLQYFQMLDLVKDMNLHADAKLSYKICLSQDPAFCIHLQNLLSRFRAALNPIQARGGAESAPPNVL